MAYPAISASSGGGLSPVASKLESVSDLVYDAILKAIVAGILPPGQQLSEAGLADQLEVSKTPVREALLRLREVGLIDRKTERGKRVVGRSMELVGTAYDVRAVLESGVARLAAERADAEQAKGLVEAARRSMHAAERDDVEGFRSWDVQFHGLIAESAGNERLIELAQNASFLTRVLREQFAPSKDEAKTCARAHLKIAAAIRKRDASSAAEAAYSHVSFAESLVERALAAQSAVGRDR